MPPHREVVTLLELIESLGQVPVETQQPQAARDERRALLRPPTEECHEIADLDAGGVPARLYRAAPAAAAIETPPGLLVWFHGGGWVLGDLDSHDNICRSLCNRTGHTILSVGYRLAPEDPFPAGLDDCIEATRWAHANAGTLRIDPDRIAVGGDSAGGNLAAAVCLVAPAPIRFQVLVYPVTDARAELPSYTEHAQGYFLTTPAMRWFVDHYLAGDQGRAEDPLVSPLLAGNDVLASAPRALVITAEFDPLRDDGIRYAERLMDAGVVTSHVHFCGQTHGFFSLTDFLSDARLAHALVAEALIAALR